MIALEQSDSQPPLAEASSGVVAQASGTGIEPPGSSAPAVPDRTWTWYRLRRLAVWTVESLVGLACLIGLLAWIGSIPFLNLLTLGYLLEVTRRVANSGRLRDGLPLLDAARRVGLLLVWGIAFCIPLRWLGQLASDAWLISPRSTQAMLWLGLLVAASVLVTAHYLLAISYGAGVFSFLRPIRNARAFGRNRREPDFWQQQGASFARFAHNLSLPHLLSQAVIAYLGVYAWVAVPTAMYAAFYDTSQAWQKVLVVAGGVCLTPILIWLPFLQLRNLIGQRLGAYFELAAARQLFCNSPFACTLAVLIPYALTASVYLYAGTFKGQLPPHDTRWDLMLIFVVSSLPGRILLGWAGHRAAKPRRVWRWWQWTCRALLLAGAGIYVYGLFFFQTSGQLGQRVLWQHLALLMPFPW